MITKNKVAFYTPFLIILQYLNHLKLISNLCNVV